MPIPFRLVIEATHTIIGHLIAPEQTDPPVRLHYRDADNRRINDLLNNLVHSSRLPWPALLLMANLVHGNAGIAARLSLGAMRPFRLCRATA